jgi:RHS repeat-associated protein
MSSVCSTHTRFRQCFQAFSTCDGVIGGYAATHFTDQDRDTETGLEHFMLRQYSSIQGRWTGPDPAGMAAADRSNPQSWNLYAYVMGNPVSYTDPLGLEPQCVHAVCPKGEGLYGGPQCYLDDIPVPCAYMWQVPGEGVEGGQGSLSNPFDVLGAKINVAGKIWHPSQTVIVGSIMDGFSISRTTGGWELNFTELDASSGTWLGWWGAFGNSFLHGPSTGDGSCVQVFADTFTPIAKQIRSQADNIRKYYGPALTSFSQIGILAEGMIYDSVRLGADRVNAAMIGGLVGAATGAIGRWGAAAVAKTPTLALAAVDAALGYALYNEIKAVSKGSCKY